MSGVSCHIPVMKAEVLSGLHAKSGGHYLDCTVGGAGHTKAILDENSNNKVVACDRDARAISRAQQFLADYDQRVEFHKASFKDLQQVAGERKFEGVLADLGLSSDQLSENRGFSFHDSAALDMRMDESQPLSAATIIQDSALPDLVRILKEGGLKKEARQVASAIIEGRPFSNTKELADCVRPVCERFEHGKHRDAATLVFQALRMAVNEERSQIIALLEVVPGLVVSGGRFLCISFHSNEDALVAKAMRRWQGSEQMPALHPGYKPPQILGTLHTKKALVPSGEEIRSNPRARSARLRVFEFN